MIKNIIKRVIVGVLIAIILGCINSCKVNALEMAAPVKFADKNTLQWQDMYDPIRYVRYNYIWYYTTNNLYPPKIATAYDTSDTTKYDRDKLYTVSFMTYIDQSNLENNMQFIAEFSSANCRVENSRGMAPGELYDTLGWFNIIICDDVHFQDDFTYLNVWVEGPTFVNAIPFRIGPMYYTESTNNEIVETMHSQLDKLNEIKSQQEQTTNAVEDMNDTLKDDNVDSPGSAITDNSNKVATNGVISDLVTLPITLFQNILNAISGTCQNFELGTLFNYNLVMPCINLQNILGSTIYTIIDIICSGFFVFVTGRKMIDIFNNLSQLKEGDLLK